jgi:hypothetical protein
LLVVAADLRAIASQVAQVATLKGCLHWLPEQQLQLPLVAEEEVWDIMLPQATAEQLHLEHT